MGNRVDQILYSLLILGRVVWSSASMQPYLFGSLGLLRVAVRLLYFGASILPFKILMTVAPDYQPPDLLAPHFQSTTHFTYLLVAAVILALIMAKGLEAVIESMKRGAVARFLGEDYQKKQKRRRNLIKLVSKATEAFASMIIGAGALSLLALISFPTCAAMVVASIASIVFLLSVDDARFAVISSTPMAYREKCITAISLLSFVVLVQTSLSAQTPPQFLMLVVCLILIRQFCQSIENIVGILLNIHQDEEMIGRIFQAG